MLADAASQAPTAAPSLGAPSLVPPPPLAPLLFAPPASLGAQGVYPGPVLSAPPPVLAPSGRYYSPGLLTFIHGVLFVILVGIAVALWVKCMCCARFLERRRARRRAGEVPPSLDLLDRIEGGGQLHMSQSHLAPPARLDPTLLPFLPQQVFAAGQGALVPPPGVKVVGACLCDPAMQQQGDRGVDQDKGEAGGSGADQGADKEAGQGGRECPVCLCEYEGGDVVKWLPDCGHAFHSSCILAWLQSRSTCPICRVQVGPALRELASQAKAAQESQGEEVGNGQQRDDGSLMTRNDTEDAPVPMGAAPAEEAGGRGT